jgi:ribosomal protein L14
MLQLNTKIKCEENSGIEAIRIFHLGQKKRKHGAYASINNLVKGSVTNCLPNKKYFTGDKLSLLVVHVKKKISRHNGCYINFDANKGIILSDVSKRKPLSTISDLTVPKEIKRDKRNKLIYKIVSQAI